MHEFIHSAVKFPGIVLALGNILINRIIDQTARGFGDDPENLARIGVYKVLFEQNDEISSPGEMFATMAQNPSNQNNRMSFLEGMKISDEAKEKLFGDMEDAQREPLMNSAEKLVELLESVPANLENWHDITPVGQYVTAVRACNKLTDTLTRVQGWIGEAETKAKRQEENGLPPTATNTPSHRRNLARLASTQEALKAFPPLIDALEAEFADDLAEAVEAGVRIPERLVRAA